LAVPIDKNVAGETPALQQQSSFTIRWCADISFPLPDQITSYNGGAPDWRPIFLLIQSRLAILSGMAMEFAFPKVGKTA
jgi:hypothetical protein